MKETTIAFIGRAANFSPNSVGKDTAILAAVRSTLSHKGYRCRDMVWEDRPTDMGGADVFVSMGRLQDTLNWLGDFERQWQVVVNPTASVMLCKQRHLLMSLLENTEVNIPPHIGSHGYWVKRADTWAQTPADIQYAADREAADALCLQMEERDVLTVDVRAHVVGDVVKFYAVSGTDFFRYYYPGDDGDWKFGDEARNGRPHHYPFDTDRLLAMVQRAADLTMLDVYGGDCIIQPDGQPVLIDLNDWPSFSRCREDAAQAIATRIEQRIEETDGNKPIWSYRGVSF